MCVTSPTRRKKADSKTKNNRPREVLILTLIFLPPLHLDGPEVHRLQVHKHKALLFLSRNVKIPLECDLMLLKWEASLFPPE